MPPTLPITRGGIINSSWRKLPGKLILSFEALVHSFLWSFVRKLKSLVKKLYKVIKMSAKFLKADEDKLLLKLSRRYFKVLRLAAGLKYLKKKNPKAKSYIFHGG